MPKVKIIYTKYAGDYYDDEVITGGLDWEEVTDEELSFLQQYSYRIPTPRGTDSYPKLIVQSPVPISETISSLKEWVKKEEKAEQDRKKKAAEAKKKLAEKKLENKRKQLEQLKKELGEA
jgi:hypothetical protein